MQRGWREVYAVNTLRRIEKLLAKMVIMDQVSISELAAVHEIIRNAIVKLEGRSE